MVEAGPELRFPGRWSRHFPGWKGWVEAEGPVIKVVACWPWNTPSLFHYPLNRLYRALASLLFSSYSPREKSLPGRKSKCKSISFTVTGQSPSTLGGQQGGQHYVGELGPAGRETRSSRKGMEENQYLCLVPRLS